MQHSIVQVYFPERERSYAYYNDQFALEPGDIVFVDGKLEGLPGRVESVSYNFKINLADYKRVIGKSIASVEGEFQIMGTCMVTFDPNAAPFEKILTHFRAPDPEGTVWLRGSDGKMFSLASLKDFGFTEIVFARGCEYYEQDKVVYVSIQNGEGRAIVKGSRPFTGRRNANVLGKATQNGCLPGNRLFGIHDKRPLRHPCPFNSVLLGN